MIRTIALALAFFFAVSVHAQTAPPAQQPPAAQNDRAQERKPQPRPHGSKVVADPQKVRVDDGDTVEILWAEGDREVVRILGIDTPETAHPQYDLPYAQAFGEEARSFGAGAFATAQKIELLRSAMLDPYGRTLGYLFLDGRNYSVLVVKARLAEETVSQYGDNGFAAEAAEVVAASKTAGPLPFESPGTYRRRMRDVSRWIKETGARVP